MEKLSALYLGLEHCPLPTLKSESLLTALGGYGPFAEVTLIASFASTASCHHHLSSSPQLSSFAPPFLTAAVPIALLFFSGTVVLASGDPKVSQKSFRSGSVASFELPPRAAPPLPPSSMNLLNCSAAPFVPVWMVCPTEAAVMRAWVARSASASC